MEKERIELDKNDYDYLILGTDFSESILSAAFASRGFTCINIDSDSLYSGTLKALNLKEFLKWQDSLNKSHKDHLVENLNIKCNEEYASSMEEVIEKYGFRTFYIDIDPKMLFSSSLATNELVQIGIDNYTTFKSIKNISIFQQSSFQKLPVSKSLISKCKFLTLKEKKNFIENFDKIQKFIQNHVQKKNHNSTNEFEKEIYANPSTQVSHEFSKYLNENHSLLFTKILPNTSNKLFQDIICYCICNRVVLSSEDNMSAQELLDHFQKFVKSIGSHDVFPYLYSTYGAGDLTQVYSRISALHGSVFLINSLLNLQSIEKSDNGVLKCIFSQGEFVHELLVKNLIVGRQFQSKVRFLLQADDHEEKECFHRIIIGCKNLKSQADCKLEVPFLGIISENQTDFENSFPVRIFVMNANSQSSDNFFIVNIFTKMSQEVKPNFDILVKKVLEGLRETTDALLEPIFTITLEHKVSKIEEFSEFQDNIVFAPTFEKSLTVDPYFEESKKFLLKKNVLKRIDEKLVRKESQSGFGNEANQNEESILLTQLEAFKFAPQ